MTADLAQPIEPEHTAMKDGLTPADMFRAYYLGAHGREATQGIIKAFESLREEVEVV